MITTTIHTTTLLRLLSSHHRSTVQSHRHAASRRNYDLCRLLDGKLDLIHELRTQLEQGWEDDNTEESTTPSPNPNPNTESPTTP